MSNNPARLFVSLCMLLLTISGCEESSLRAAIEKGDEAAVVSALKSGANVNEKDEEGETPLHWAVKRKNTDVIDALLQAGAGAETPALKKKAALIAAGCESWNTEFFLRNMTSEKIGECLKAGADPNGRDSGGDTALHNAASTYNTAVISILLKAGADVNAKNKKGETPLYRAVDRDNPALITALLKAGAGTPALRKKATFIAAGCAAWNTLDFMRSATSEKISKCLKIGADPNARDKSGNTTLTNAVLGKNPAVITALLKAGADVSAKDKNGKTALQWAVTKQYAAVIDVLLKAGAGTSVLRNKAKLVAAGCVAWNTMKFMQIATLEMMADCFKAGANPNARDKEGSTLLYRVVRKGYGSAVVALLKAGADPNARELDGYAPLHRAAEKGDEEIVIALLKAGADPNARDIVDGNTPLHMVKKSDRRVLVALLKAGANPNARNGEGFTFRRTSLKRQQAAEATTRKAALKKEQDKREAEAAERRAAQEEERRRREAEAAARRAAQEEEQQRRETEAERRRATQERERIERQNLRLFQQFQQQLQQLQQMR